ncbi:hypothetical protein [Gordonia sp. NB41Y]|uniref:hypothetical protein n=1 Tax=Gordonia sp. NB41Y TaxID=875808 RepID=UPI00273B7D37|nr:hypothetical protein [Gordonia sp. NB41Y]WLP91621.1 hypothetical protein Q9K23_05020 [Gordonia sp. NB41Y]
MNTADQIEQIARATTTRLAEASREFSAVQRRLSGVADQHRQATADATARLRADLEVAADACDSPTPRILLPADVAEASPHRGRHSE